MILADTNRPWCCPSTPVVASPLKTSLSLTRLQWSSESRSPPPIKPIVVLPIIPIGPPRGSWQGVSALAGGAASLAPWRPRSTLGGSVSEPE